MKTILIITTFFVLGILKTYGQEEVFIFKHPNLDKFTPLEIVYIPIENKFWDNEQELILRSYLHLFFNDRNASIRIGNNRYNINFYPDGTLQIIKESLLSHRKNIYIIKRGVLEKTTIEIVGRFDKQKHFPYDGSKDQFKYNLLNEREARQLLLNEIKIINKNLSQINKESKKKLRKRERILRKEEKEVIEY